MNNQITSSAFILPGCFQESLKSLNYWINSEVDEIANKDQILKILYELNLSIDEFILFLEELDEESED